MEKGGYPHKSGYQEVFDGMETIAKSRVPDGGPEVQLFLTETTYFQTSVEMLLL